MKKIASIIITIVLIVCSTFIGANATEQDTIFSPSIGSIVRFGHYEQDNDMSNGKEIIEWIVLDVKEDRALLLSKYGLDKMDYGTRNANITWEKSAIRTWLNKTFLKEAFSAEEQKAILTTTVDNSKKQGNEEWNTKGGNNTKDKLFLLSYYEAFEQYFGSKTERLCAPTDYADPKNNVRSRHFDAVLVDGRATYIWWLRSPGTTQNQVVNVSKEGGWLTSSPTPKGTNYLPHLIRPAMWIDLNSETLSNYDQPDSAEAPLQEVLDNETNETSERWFDGLGCGRYLPKLTLLSGEELQIEKGMINDYDLFFVQVRNATLEDYESYVKLLIRFGFTIPLGEGESTLIDFDAQNEDGLEAYAYYSDDGILTIICRTTL